MHLPQHRDKNETFPRLRNDENQDVAGRNQPRHGRMRPGGAALARISRDARHVAQGRPGPRARLHGSVRGSARLWRLVQTEGPARPCQLFQARDGAGHGRGHERARPPALPPRRPRPRRSRRAPPRARPRQPRTFTCGTGYLADAARVRKHGHGAGARLLSLVLPHPGITDAGAHDRQHAQGLPAAAHRPRPGRTQELSESGAARIPALLRCARHPRLLRGLSRRRKHRPGARQEKPETEACDAGACALGEAFPRGHDVRLPRELARGGARRARPRARLRSFPARGKARRSAARAARLPGAVPELKTRELSRRGLLGPDEGWSLAPVAAWLAIEGRRIAKPEALLAALAGRLDAAGAHVDRLSMSVVTLHPQLLAWVCTWRRDGPVTFFNGRHGAQNSDAYVGSPLYLVREHGEPFRRRIEALDEARDHSFLHEMQAAGMTDYAAMPIVFGN